MHSAIHRSLRVLVFAVMSGLLVMTAGTAVAAPKNSAAAQGCPGRQAPPAPVDTSERPAPGQEVPAPLPVPAKPVGGDRMGECGLVLPEGAKNPPDVTSASWVLQDLDTGAVLAAKDPHARERPASLIKTLLALVAVKELRPDQVITATPEDVAQECTCVGITAGAKYTVDQLLHGLLMHSGNDVAHALAAALGGVPETVRKMNSLAESLGATDTRVATPSGLDGPGMTTSAYDLSIIFYQAMKQPEFAKTVGTRTYQFPGAADKAPFPLINDNKLLGTYPGFLGGKTGFTDDARHTYVGGAEQNGKRIAIVTMRGEQRPTRVSDQAATLLDYGFALSKAGTQPVGQIVNLSTASGSEENGGSGISTGSTQAAKASQDPFGTTGWLITLLVAVLIVIGFFVGRRRKASVQD